MKKVLIIIGVLIILIIISLFIFSELFDQNSNSSEDLSLNVESDSSVANNIESSIEIGIEEKSNNSIINNTIQWKGQEQNSDSGTKEKQNVKIKKNDPIDYANNTNKQDSKDNGKSNNNPKEDNPVVTPPKEDIPTIIPPKEDTPTVIPPKQDIKKISDEEFNSAKSTYLSDIKNIAPGLNYKFQKRGQVFWPYRTSEIEIFTKGIDFGTVYYYIEKFVESNQEKLKYYIDWGGN